MALVKCMLQCLGASQRMSIRRKQYMVKCDDFFRHMFLHAELVLREFVDRGHSESLFKVRLPCRFLLSVCS